MYSIVTCPTPTGGGFVRDEVYHVARNDLPWESGSTDRVAWRPGPALEAWPATKTAHQRRRRNPQIAVCSTKLLHPEIYTRAMPHSHASVLVMFPYNLRRSRAGSHEADSRSSGHLEQEAVAGPLTEYKMKCLRSLGFAA